jgi:hypothetical protein
LCGASVLDVQNRIEDFHNALLEALIPYSGGDPNTLMHWARHIGRCYLPQIKITTRSWQMKTKSQAIQAG